LSVAHVWEEYLEHPIGEQRRREMWTSLVTDLSQNLAFHTMRAFDRPPIWQL
jgi:hypothetical protein